MDWPNRPLVKRFWTWALGGGLLLLSGGWAVADVPLSVGGDAYQRDLVAQAMRSHDLEPEPNPQGKVIERIVVVPFDVILSNDPWPDFLNWFHFTTVPYVVKRELLFKEGDVWDQSHVSESARNMRRDLFLSTAGISAARGSAPDRVVVLVVTKDLWSLRPNMSFSFVGSTIERIDAEIAEHNLLGRMKQATIDLGLNIATVYAGQQYRDPRLLGSQLLLYEKGDLIWNRSSGVLEGGVASLSVEQPLYTLDTPWAWGAALQYRKDIYRFFSAGQIAEVTSPVTGQSLPYVMNRRLADLTLSVTRSFGREHKRNFSFGYKAWSHDFSLPDAPAGTSAATVSNISSLIVPRSESVGLLFAGVRFYEAGFRELLDINTFGITEDFRFGPDVSAELRFASSAFGFSSSFVQPLVNASWSVYQSDDLFSVGSNAEIRYQPQTESASPWVNGEATVYTRNVSPRWKLLRLHNLVSFTRRYNNLNRDFSTLGGNNSLRGYPSSYLRGANMWIANTEVRTLPVVWATMHIGFAAFFDVGGAADNLSAAGAYPSVGAGLRIGFPQFNREVLRVDFGVPLQPVVGADPAYIVAQYGQAF